MTSLRFVRPRISRGPGGTREVPPPGAGVMGPGTAVDDAPLLAAIRAGDPAFADAFCRRVWPQVDRTVRRLVGGDDSESEDLTQLAIIELVRATVRYRGEASLDTWVTAVTAHVVYRHLRRRRRDRKASMVVVDTRAPAGAIPSSEAALGAREALSRILRHLSALGDKLALTFVLHDVLGYDLGEAARLQGATEAATQSRLVRSRRKLHQRIATDPELADLIGRED